MKGTFIVTADRSGVTNSACDRNRLITEKM
jgi:hypothetical protein